MGWEQASLKQDRRLLSWAHSPCHCQSSPPHGLSRGSLGWARGRQGLTKDSRSAGSSLACSHLRCVTFSQALTSLCLDKRKLLDPITLLNTGLGGLRPFQACRRALRTNNRPLLLNLASFFLFLEPEQQVQPVLAQQRDLCLSALNPEPEGSPCRWRVMALTLCRLKKKSSCGKSPGFAA